MKRLLALVLTLSMLTAALPPAATRAVGDGTLKILTIGNASAVDATEYLYDIAQAEGLSVVLGVASYSGGTVQQHAAFGQSNAAVYRYYKNVSGAWTPSLNVTLQSCITNEDWDVICFQHGMEEAAQPAAYAGLDALLDYVDAHKTNAETKYAWHMTWAYQAGYPTDAFTAESQMTMFENIAEAVQQVIASDNRFDYIIPAGTAIQDARSSQMGDNLTTDGQSLNGAGKLIAGYTWYAVLTDTQPEVLNYAAADGETLSAANQSMVLEAVGNAYADPYDFTQSRYTAGRNTHYTFTRNSGYASTNYELLPTNVTYEGSSTGTAATRARQLLQGEYYGAGGRVSLTTYSLYNGTAVYTDSTTGKSYSYGLPYRDIEYNGSTKRVSAESMWFELGKMPALDTAGKAAVNLSMRYPHAFLQGSGGAAYQRNLLVQVSLDGSTFLPGYAGVRSARLLGGGQAQGNIPIMVYTLETENLLDIPGVAGNTIKKIRILPFGDHDHPVGRHYIYDIMVNTYDTAEAFQLSVPSDLELIDVGESAMRNIAVAEAIRTATIPWRTNTNMHTTFNTSNHCYYASNKYMIGPTYERDIDSTRELFVSGIDANGYWGANGAGFDLDANGTNTAYGMDCQSFVWNAIARVSRSYGWGIPYYFGDTYMKMLGNLDDVYPMSYYSDADVIATHTPEQMYAAYAEVQPGDVIGTYQWGGSSHTRLVTSVDVVYNTDDGSIDPEASVIHTAEQASIPGWLDADYQFISRDTIRPANAVYWASSRPDSVHTFSSLLSSNYVPFTLTDYADGKIAREDVQIVAGPLVAGGAFTDGVNIAIASNYRLTKYTVTLKNLSNDSNVFSATVWNKDARRAWANYQSTTLNNALADLHDGRYRLSVAVDSGPLLSTTQSQVPTTTKNFDFTVGTGTGRPCSGGVHGDDWKQVSSITDLGTKKGNSNTTSYYQVSGGKYYLTQNVSTAYQISINGDVTLCLNGRQLSGTNATQYNNNYYFITLATGCTLNLCDCMGGGTVTLDPLPTQLTEAVCVPYANATFNFYGGTITGFHTRTGVIRSIGTVNMYEGASISGNDCSATSVNAYNSAVHLFSNNAGTNTATFNMYGGTIENNDCCAVVCLDPNIASANMKAPTKPAIAVFNMYGGTIENNTATTLSSSAPILQKNTGGGTSAFNMYGGVISDNSGSAAGAVSLLPGAAFTMSGGTISENTASNQGGAVSLSGSSTLPTVFEMTGGSIIGNSAASQGGGVAVGAYGVCDFSGGSISGNTAPTGGGICVNSASASLTVSSAASVTGNNAASGGGIAVVSGAANLAGGTISGNTASDQGGGLSVTEGSITMANVTVSGNMVTGAEGTGGGIFVGSLSADVSPALLLTHGVTLSGNTAKSGAALRAAHGTVNVTGGTVTGNNGPVGPGTGVGPVYLSDSAVLNLSGGTVTDNRSASAAVYVASAALNVSGGSVTANLSTDQGGGVVLDAGGVLTLTGGEISGNTGNLGQDVLLAGDNAKLNMTAGQIGAGNSGATLWSAVGDGEKATVNIYGGTVATAVGHGTNHSSADYDTNVFGGGVYAISSAEGTYEDIKFHRGYTSADEDTLSAVVARAGGGSENVFPGGSSGYTYQVEPDYDQKANMLLSDDLTFYMHLANNNAWTTHALVDGSDLAVTRVPTSATVSMPGRALPFDVTVEQDTDAGTLVIPIPIFAKEMADTITVTVKDSTGGEIETFTDSVRDYAGRILTSEDATATEKTLMVDMLNYGAAAQSYFSFHTEELANAQLTAAQSSLATISPLTYAESNTVHTLAYHSANLTLEERIDFAMYFWVNRIGADKNYTYTVKNGSTTVISGGGTFSDKLDGADGYLYEVHIPDLNLSAMSRAVISLTYQDKDGNTYTAKDSMANYLCRNDGLAINDAPQSYTINNDGTIKTEGGKSGTDGSDLYAKVMAFAAASARYADEQQQVYYDLQDSDVIFVPGAAKSGKQSEAYILSSATQPAGTKAIVTIPAGTANADGSTHSSSSNQSSGRFWVMSGGTLKRAEGLYESNTSPLAYKFGYHDALKYYHDEPGSLVTFEHASRHTGSGSKCTCKFDVACGYSTTTYRYRECSRRQTVTDDLIILDLRASVLAGTETAVTTVAEIVALSAAGSAVVNTYVPDGVASTTASTNHSVGVTCGTAAAIIVIDHSPV